MQLQLQDLLLGSSPDGIVLFDLASAITAWNPKMEQLFGEPAAAVLGCRLGDPPVAGLFSADTPGICRQILRGGSAPLNTIHAARAGGHPFFEALYFPLLTHGGEVAGGAAVFREAKLPADLSKLSSRTYIQFQDVLEKMADAFVALDSNWRYTYVNKKAADIFNRDQAYLTGKHIWTEFPEGIDQPFYKAYYRAVHERVPITLEEYYPPYDKWFENRIFPLEDGLAIFFSDVTQRKKEQQALQASYAALQVSEARLRSVLDSLFIFAGLLSTDGTLLHINAIPLLASGVAPEAVLGKPFWETPWWSHSAEERNKLRENLRKAARGETVRYDASVLDKKGNVLFLDVAFGPLYDEQGKVVQLVGSGVDVTSQRKARQQLHESHERYQALADNFPNGAVFLFDHDLRFQVAGGTELAKVGLAKEMLIGKTLAEVLPPRVVTALEPAYLSTLRGESMVYEDQQGGDWYKIRTTPVRNENQEVVAGLVMAQNITREKQAEAELRFYQVLVDNTADPIYWISPDDNFRFSYVNRAACEHYGLPAEKLLSMSIPDWDPDFTWEDCDRFREMIREKKGVVFETQHRHSSGEIIPVEITATLLYYNGKEYFAGYIKDLRERKRVEAALRESEERYRHLFHANQDPLFLLDLETRGITDANPAACRVYGYTREELLKLQNTDLSAEPEQTIQSVLEKATFAPLRYHRKKDGSVFPVELRFSHLLINGRPMGIAAARDITLRVEAEQQQQELNRELIRQNEQLQQFTFITSHNLRAPVASLLGLLNLYNPEDAADPINLTVVAHLEQAVRRLDEVIHDLNELLVVRKHREEQQEVRFGQVFEQVRLIIAGQIENNQARLTVHLEAAPAVFSVKSYVQSILLNLLSNAIKYRSPGRPLEIRVETRREDPYVVLTVSDNGLGIDLRKYGEKLFGLYRRFHTHVEGKGLGLHLVKTQIEALGGKVEVESRPGAGSTFKIFFLQYAT